MRNGDESRWARLVVKSGVMPAAVTARGLAQLSVGLDVSTGG